MQVCMCWSMKYYGRRVQAREGRISQLFAHYIFWVLGGSCAGGVAAEEAVRAGGIRSNVPQAELGAAGLRVRCKHPVNAC